MLFGVLSADGNSIEYTDCIRYCGDWEGEISASQLASLFSTGNKVTFEAFSQWIEKNVEVHIIIIVIEPGIAKKHNYLVLGVLQVYWSFKNLSGLF